MPGPPPSTRAGASRQQLPAGPGAGLLPLYGPTRHAHVQREYAGGHADPDPGARLEPGERSPGGQRADSQHAAQQPDGSGLNPLEVAHWTGNGWQTLVMPAQGGTPMGTDFPLDAQSGYFVFVQNGGPWPAG